MKTIGESLAAPHRTTKVPTFQVRSEKVADALDRLGWKREIAGEEDFGRAVDAVTKMLQLGKGILVTGEAGVGKTELIKVLSRNILGLTSMNWYYCKEQSDMDLLRGSNCEALRWSVILDDIGSENISKEYGNRIDIVGDFIQRYHYRGNGRFLATTNLHSSRYVKDANGNLIDRYKFDQLNELYGGRVIDRLFEMCVVLRLTGKTKRERMIV